MASIRRLSGVTILTIVALLVLAAPGAAQRQRTAPPMEVARADQADRAEAAVRNWSGTAGVGVEVRDRDGQPIEGAEVRLTFAEAGEGDQGPPPVTTDASGRAAVRGLAEGEWVLTIRHPETMAYVATLEVRQGRRPREVNASQVKVGESLRSLRLKYFEASGPAERPPRPEPVPERAPVETAPAKEPAAPTTPAPAPRAAPERPARPEAEAKPPAETAPETKPESPAAAAPEESPAPGESAAPEEPKAEPMATEEPSAPAAEPSAAPAEPSAMPEEPSAMPEEPSAMPEEPAAEQAAPAPEPEAAPEPPAAELSAPASAPRRSTLRSYESGSCPECRPGEWSVTAEGRAAPGSGSCPDDLKARIDRAAALLGSSRPLGPWTGPVEIAGGASSVLGSEAYGQFTQAVREVLADDATCRVLAVMLPAGATFVGLEAEVADGGSWRQCLPRQECVDGGRWVGDPWLIRTPAGPMVAGAYGNGGAEARRIRLTVYFTAPEGWAPR